MSGGNFFDGEFQHFDHYHKALWDISKRACSLCPNQHDTIVSMYRAAISSSDRTVLYSYSRNLLPLMLEISHKEYEEFLRFQLETITTAMAESLRDLINNKPEF